MTSPRFRRACLAFLLCAAPMPALAQGDAPLVFQPANPDDPVEALSRYLRLLSANPRSLEALTGAGRAALQVGDANAAVGFYARAQDVAPRNGRVKAGLGAALVQMDQPREALKLFAQAIDLGVPEANVAGDRGLAHDLRGDTRKALADYQLALRSRPDDETVRRMAVSMAIAGDRAGAIAALDPLLRKQDKAAWRARTFVLALTGDTVGAREGIAQLLPRPQADAMAPFLARLASLKSTEKALAVHFGQFPSDGRKYRSDEMFADAGLVPTPAPATVTRSEADRPLVPAGAPLGSVAVAAAPGFTDAFAKPADPAARATRRRPGREFLAFQGGYQRRIPTPPARKPVETAIVQPTPAPVKSTPAPVITPPPTAVIAERPPLANPSVRETQTAAQTPSVSPGFDLAQLTPAATPPPREVPEPPTAEPSGLALADKPSAASMAAAAKPTPPPPVREAAKPPASAPTGLALAGKPSASAMAAAAEPVKAPVGRPADKPLVLATRDPDRGPPTKPADVKPKASIPAEPKPKALAKDRKAVGADATPLKLADAKATKKDDKAAKPADAKDSKKDTRSTKSTDAKDAKAKPATAKKAPERYWVQVAGGANKATLPKAWAGLKTRYGKELAGQSPWTTPLRFTNRLLVGPFKSEGEAQAFVNGTAKSGWSTFTFTSPAGQEVEKLAL